MQHQLDAPLGFAKLATDPVVALSSNTYYNTVTNRLRYYNGSAWQDVGGGGTINNRALTMGADGAGVLPLTGVMGYFQIPYPGTIYGWAAWTKDGLTITAQFDIWKIADGGALPTVANTITASAKPTLTAVNHTSSTTLTGWTVAVATGDWFAYNLDSISGAAKGVNLELKIAAS